jgi:hypothetical protein
MPHVPVEVSQPLGRKRLGYPTPAPLVPKPTDHDFDALSVMADRNQYPFKGEYVDLIGQADLHSD